MFESIVSEGVWSLLLCSGVPLTLSSLAALGLVVLQAATQVQEQTLVFLCRLVALVITLIFAGEWLFQGVVDLTIDSFRAIIAIGRG